MARGTRLSGTRRTLVVNLDASPAPATNLLSGGAYGGNGPLTGSTRFANVSITGSLRVTQNKVVLDRSGITLIGAVNLGDDVGLAFIQNQGDSRINNAAQLFLQPASGNTQWFQAGIRKLGQGAFIGFYADSGTSGSGKVQISPLVDSAWNSTSYVFTNTQLTITQVADPGKPITLQAGQGTFPAGVVVKTKAGVPVDADFASFADGLLAVDTTNKRLYYRAGATWDYAALSGHNHDSTYLALSGGILTGALTATQLKGPHLIRIPSTSMVGGGVIDRTAIGANEETTSADVRGSYGIGSGALGIGGMLEIFGATGAVADYSRIYSADDGNVSGEAGTTIQNVAANLGIWCPVTLGTGANAGKVKLFLSANGLRARFTATHYWQ